jgi:hypothetical protein
VYFLNSESLSNIGRAFSLFVTKRAIWVYGDDHHHRSQDSVSNAQSNKTKKDPCLQGPS